MFEKDLSEFLKSKNKSRIIFGYPVINGFYSNFDKEIFSVIVNTIYHSYPNSLKTQEEGHIFHLDNLKYESYFKDSHRETDICYIENITNVSDWISNEFNEIPDCSQISSKTPIGLRIENYEKKRYNTKDFPPSNQYHHIESFSKMNIDISNICRIEFNRTKDITDNIYCHQIVIYPFSEKIDELIRLIGVIDNLFSIVNPKNNYDIRNISRIKVNDLR